MHVRIVNTTDAIQHASIVRSWHPYYPILQATQVEGNEHVTLAMFGPRGGLLAESKVPMQLVRELLQHMEHFERQQEDE